MGLLLNTNNYSDIPSDFDCINKYNEGSVYKKSESDSYKYQSDGVTLGASGPNIRVSFDTKEIILDDSQNIKSCFVSGKDEDGLPKNYTNPNYPSYYRSYQRDEIYRFAIRFFDKKGYSTTPLWICDLRIPDIFEMPHYHYDDTDGILKGYILSPKFIVKNSPENAVGYQIMRTVRTEFDRSVVSQGVIRPTLISHTFDKAMNTGSRDGEGIQPCPGGGNQVLGLTQQTVQSYFYDNYRLDFYCPELSFYREKFSTNGSYLDILGYLKNYYTDSDIYKIFEESYGTKPISIMRKNYTDIDKQITVDSNLEDINLISTDSNYMGFDHVGSTGTGWDNYTVIGGKKFWHQTMRRSTDDLKLALSRKNLGMVFHTKIRENITSYNPWADSDSNKDFKALMMAVYKRDIYNLMYGGNTFESRRNNYYTPISSVKDISEGYVTPFNGDTFISAFDLQMVSYEYSVPESLGYSHCTWGEVEVVPLESTVNMELRQGSYATSYSSVPNKFKYLNEDGFEAENVEPLYVYNSVYTKNIGLNSQPVLPKEQRNRLANKFNNRIIASENKINGELYDSWINYPVNNYIDVDSRYGEIIELFVFRNKLYFIQERAVGFTAVNERSLIEDSSGQKLALGTGGLLDRYEYVSTEFGSNDRKSVIKTLRGVYWFDRYSNDIVKMSVGDNNSLEVISLSKSKSLQPFMNKYNFTSCISGKDEQMDEVLFTLYNDAGDVKTLVFNERIGTFQSLYSMDPTHYINVNKNLISTNDNRNLYIHDDESDFGKFYDSIYDSSIKILVNSDMSYTKVFDIINYFNESKDSENNNIFYDTFDNILVYNTYQNSDKITLEPKKNITKKGKDWSLHVPRNSVTGNLSDNPDIFDPANLEINKLYKERMRDKYLIEEFTYDNSNNYRFYVPYILTKYRLSYR